MAIPLSKGKRLGYGLEVRPNGEHCWLCSATGGASLQGLKDRTCVLRIREARWAEYVTPKGDGSGNRGRCYGLKSSET